MTTMITEIELVRRLITKMVETTQVCCMPYPSNRRLVNMEPVQAAIEALIRKIAQRATIIVTKLSNRPIYSQSWPQISDLPLLHQTRKLARRSEEVRRW